MNRRCCCRKEPSPSITLKIITILCLFVGTITVVSGFVTTPPAVSTVLRNNAKAKRQRQLYYAREAKKSSPVNTSPPPPSITTTTHTSVHRRSLLASLLTATTTTTPLLLLLTTPLPSQAACLPGDDSPSCIGIYKVPIDDAILPYTSTPERLATYAPGIKWVPPIAPPPSYPAAVDELRQRQKQMDDVRDCILRGDLESGGVLLLRLMPRVTAAGRVVERTLEVAGDDSSMRAYRVSVALENLQGLLGQCDVMIGQGLRGEMGALTVAQIGILSGLDEVVTEWKELMVAIPEGGVGGKVKRGK